MLWSWINCLARFLVIIDNTIMSVSISVPSSHCIRRQSHVLNNTYTSLEVEVIKLADMEAILKRELCPKHITLRHLTSFFLNNQQHVAKFVAFLCEKTWPLSATLYRILSAFIIYPKRASDYFVQLLFPFLFNFIFSRNLSKCYNK